MILTLFGSDYFILEQNKIRNKIIPFFNKCFFQKRNEIYFSAQN